jgi:hypothetical protein
VEISCEFGIEPSGSMKCWDLNTKIALDDAITRGITAFDKRSVSRAHSAYS